MNMDEYYTRAMQTRVYPKQDENNADWRDYAEPDETEFTPVDIITLAEWEALDVQPPDFLMGEIRRAAASVLQK
jgi:hypothetical protein